MNQHLIFIGGGNMADALISGLIRQGWSSEHIQVLEPFAEQAARLVTKHHIHVADTASGIDFSRVDAVILAVKPQAAAEACSAIAEQVKRGIVVSIMAGIHASAIRRWLPHALKIIRAMPNTPALIGKGMTGLWADDACLESDKALATTILSAAGATLWVSPEAKIDAVTAISGSGPAYVFYAIEALIGAARELGFDEASAKQLTLATFDGATALALQSPESVETLRERVTSKGGTTERGIAVLRSRDLKQIFTEAAQAALARAEEMGLANN